MNFIRGHGKAYFDEATLPRARLFSKRAKAALRFQRCLPLLRSRCHRGDGGETKADKSTTDLPTVRLAQCPGTKHSRPCRNCKRHHGVKRNVRNQHLGGNLNDKLVKCRACVWSLNGNKEKIVSWIITQFLCCSHISRPTSTTFTRTWCRSCNNAITLQGKWYMKTNVRIFWWSPVLYGTKCLNWRLITTSTITRQHLAND